MTTDVQYLAWLKSASAARCVLIEVGVRSGASEITRYLSNAGYVSGPADTPANTTYHSVVSGGISLTESISITGGGTLNSGDIELHNQQGELDPWFSDVWVNRAIQIYIGDKRWARADFRLVFDGIVADVDSRARDKFNIKLRDKLQRLNTPVSEIKLGGTTANLDRLVPLTFGEVHNVTPLLTNPATHEYQVHGSAIEDIIEVRDEGVPVAITKSVGTGKFTLNQSNAGVITASVQGDKPATYSNQIAALVQRLATGYGTAVNQFSTTDIDTANFSTFAAANPQPVGLYLDQRANVLQSIQQLAASVGAQPVMSRAGKLRLLKIALPAVGTPTVVTASDIVAGSLQIVSRTEVVAGVMIGYCKNWTLQPQIQTAIPPEHKDLFKQQYLTITVKDATVASAYKLFAEPVEQDTLLLTTADATAEAQRRLNLYKVPRTVYQFTGFAASLFLELGQAVTLKHYRYGMTAGVTGMVISLTPDWLAGTTVVQVLV